MTQPAKSSTLDRWAPLGFVVLGVAMIAIAAAAGLAASLAVTFAVLGAALVVAGGFAGRLEGPFKLGPGGIEGQLGALLTTMEGVAAEQATKDALSVRESGVEDSDNWFLDYQAHVRELGEAASDPFARAALLRQAYEKRRGNSAG
jgi:hypothetical protein